MDGEVGVGGSINAVRTNKIRHSSYLIVLSLSTGTSKSRLSSEVLEAVSFPNGQLEEIGISGFLTPHSDSATFKTLRFKSNFN